MASEKTLHCNVITPERKVLECDASFVALPAYDGEIGFMHNRAPLLCKLGAGELRVVAEEGGKRYFVNGGFAQMLNNQLTVLTEQAEDAGTIDSAAVEQELAEALALTAGDEASRRARETAIIRAKARKRMIMRG